MPMQNLRHQIKSGRRDRRTGAAAPDADRSYLPNIGQAAQVYQGHGIAREYDNAESPPEPAVKLPYLPKAPAADKPGKVRPTPASGVQLQVIGESCASAAKKASKARPANSEVQLPAIGEPNAPADNKPNNVRPKTSRGLRLPAIDEPNAPAADKFSRARLETSGFFLPAIDEPNAKARTETSGVRFPAIVEPSAPVDKPNKARTETNEVRLPAIRVPNAPSADKPNNVRPKTSRGRLRLPAIDEPNAPAADKPSKARLANSEVRLPAIGEPAPGVEIFSRAWLVENGFILPAIHEPNDPPAKPSKARPENSEVRLPAIGESNSPTADKPCKARPANSEVPAANKPAKARPTASHVQLPAISDDSLVRAKRQPVYAQDRQIVVPDINQYLPHPPVGQKPTQTKASAAVKFPPIQMAPDELQRKLSAATGQSYSEHALNNLPYLPKPPANPPTRDAEILAKKGKEPFETAGTG